MAVQTRLVRRRIKSIRSTRKIMKAMELVAASKMRKATQQTLASRPYAHFIRDMVQDLRNRVDPDAHPLFAGRWGKGAGRTILIAAASDRGLCGGFNSQLVRASVEFLKTRKEKVDLVTVGRRAEAIRRRGDWKVEASFPSIANAPSYDGILAIAQYVSSEFLEAKADRVFFAFTDFKGAMSQVPVVVQLLPLIPEAELAKIHKVDAEVDFSGAFDATDHLVFEPSPDAVLEGLLSRMLQIQIYQALLESAASEHSARMLAMRSAGDAAHDMLDGLTLTLNQARQASITREISEISAGKAAIE